MRKMNLVIMLLIVISGVFSSCSDDTPMRKKVTGKAGELVVVIPKKTWEGAVGEAVQKILSQAQISLPQEEPIFDLINVPPAAFQDIFKTSRNIVKVNISSTIDSAQVILKDDVYAWPQAVVEIQAKSDEDLLKTLNENSNLIVAYLLKAERERLMITYNDYYDKAAREIIQDKFDIKMSLPPGFIVAKQTDDFAWFRYDTPRLLQGIAIHTFPYTSEDIFSADFLINKRDSLLKENTEGPTEGSYMATEKMMDPVFSTFRINNNYASEMRGLWKLENDFMGGPFINLAILDVSNQRVIMLDGFVYAPQSDKRNYLRQVEAILRSIVLPNQAMNDKITSELNMGN